jgi:hypothetical protein
VYPARSCNCDRLCTCRGHTRSPVSRAPIRCGAASRRRCAKPSDGLRFHRMRAWPNRRLPSPGPNRRTSSCSGSGRRRKRCYKLEDEQLTLTTPRGRREKCGSFPFESSRWKLRRAQYSASFRSLARFSRSDPPPRRSGRCAAKTGRDREDPDRGRGRRARWQLHDDFSRGEARDERECRAQHRPVYARVQRKHGDSGNPGSLHPQGGWQDPRGRSDADLFAGSAGLTTGAEVHRPQAEGCRLSGCARRRHGGLHGQADPQAVLFGTVL